MEFNNAQREAVNHFKGAAMVLAGPGSGKDVYKRQRKYYGI